MAIRAVMFDFGGVVTTSPFEAFARLEAERSLPAGFIRTVNATNPDENAWARLERNELSLDAFAAAWAAEARALGHAGAHIVPEHFTEVKTRKHQWIAKTEAAVKDRAHQGNCVLGSPMKLLRSSPASSEPM